PPRRMVRGRWAPIRGIGRFSPTVHSTFAVPFAAVCRRPKRSEGWALRTHPSPTSLLLKSAGAALEVDGRIAGGNDAQTLELRAGPVSDGRIVGTHVGAPGPTCATVVTDHTQLRGTRLAVALANSGDVRRRADNTDRVAETRR